MTGLPVIPETVTVHLGRPEQNAENITVSFTEYIKNVASSEIYPTWPEEAIRANVLAQISFTLNRIYTEYYRSRGYDFDITSDTTIDHKYTKNGEIFDTVSIIVDENFNNYIRRENAIEPYYAQFCDGRVTVCDGMSQWGSVALAQSGMTATEILRYYYGDDIVIVYDAPVGGDTESYPGIPLQRGSFGADVVILKRELNRIALNYPAVPRIENLSGVFDDETENAVIEFQRIFNLAPDGIVGKATWYKVKQIFASVKQLSELASEGLTISEVERRYTEELSLGSRTPGVEAVQYYLAFLGYFYPELPPIDISGEFDTATRDAVFTFQSAFGLPITGVVDRGVFDAIETEYYNAVSALPADFRSVIGEPYPGRFLTFGDRGDSVRIIQGYLRRLASSDSAIPTVDVDGIFGNQTRQAVLALQRQLGLEETGAIGPVEWAEILIRGGGIEG